MSRSKNSRRGSKYVRGCPGCSQCDHNRPERQLPASDNSIVLSEEDWGVFMDMLTNPKPASEKMLQLVRDARKHLEKGDV